MTLLLSHTEDTVNDTTVAPLMTPLWQHERYRWHPCCNQKEPGEQSRSGVQPASEGDVGQQGSGTWWGYPGNGWWGTRCGPLWCTVYPLRVLIYRIFIDFTGFSSKFIDFHRFFIDFHRFSDPSDQISDQFGQKIDKAGAGVGK